MFAKPFSLTTPKINLAPLGALSSESLLGVEVSRRLKRAPLASAQPLGSGGGLAKQWVE